jgi:hypothetical protein
MQHIGQCSFVLCYLLFLVDYQLEVFCSGNYGFFFLILPYHAILFYSAYYCPCRLLFVHTNLQCQATRTLFLVPFQYCSYTQKLTYVEDCPFLLLYLEHRVGPSSCLAMPPPPLPSLQHCPTMYYFLRQRRGQMSSLRRL